MNKKYSIQVISPNGHISYMSHRDKTKFCKRTAKKHLKDCGALKSFELKIIEAD